MLANYGGIEEFGKFRSPKLRMALTRARQVDLGEPSWFCSLIRAGCHRHRPGAQSVLLWSRPCPVVAGLPTLPPSQARGTESPACFDQQALPQAFDRSFRQVHEARNLPQRFAPKEVLQDIGGSLPHL